MPTPLTIPEYPAARPLAITDREMLLAFFRDLQPTISELSFANLYLFRHVHGYMLSCLDDSLLIAGRGYDGRPYYLPPLSGDRKKAACVLLDAGHLLYGVDGQFFAEALSGYNYTVLDDRDNDDYLYLRSDLAELPGKKFHKKKNRISYFTSHNDFAVEPFTPEHLDAALCLVDVWNRAHDDRERSSQAAETAATREALIRADELGLSGVVVMTGRKIAAFALGEPLNAETTVCHFEKSDPFLEGAAQLVNREFCRFQPEERIYVNREQDLGVSGLRAAKCSYHPFAMVRKYRVYRSS